MFNWVLKGRMRATLQDKHRWARLSPIFALCSQCVATQKQPLSSYESLFFLSPSGSSRARNDCRSKISSFHTLMTTRGTTECWTGTCRDYNWKVIAALGDNMSVCAESWAFLIYVCQDWSEFGSALYFSWAGEKMPIWFLVFAVLYFLPATNTRLRVCTF